MLSPRLVERLQVRYGGLHFEMHLKRVVEESRILAGPNYEKCTRTDMALICQASTYFSHKYGIHLTVGDVSNLETDFTNTAKELWSRISRR
jgi:hypothetical protein